MPLQGTTRTPTIESALRSTAMRVPEREALVYNERRYTYAELNRAVDRAAHVLRDRGMRKGDRLALMSTNTDWFVIAFYAAQRVGAVVVPVNPASAGPEIDYLVRDSGASVLLFAPKVAAAVRDATGSGLPDELAIMCLGDDENHPDLIALADEAPSTPVDVGVAADDDAEILYTSGTTGKPKGALFDQ